jgi:hypothetical protein
MPTNTTTDISVRKAERTLSVEDEKSIFFINLNLQEAETLVKKRIANARLGYLNFGHLISNIVWSFGFRISDFGD